MGSRALGTAVHELFEELAKLKVNQGWEDARSALRRFSPRIMASIRSVGIDPAQASLLSEEALRIVLEASHDRTCQWILSPHLEGVSEVRWTGLVGGIVRTVQADRVFLAGPAPDTTGNDTWWVIDYKTSTAKSSHENVPPDLSHLRTFFAPQLEAYAHVLRNLRGKTARFRAGLYYPRMKLFDWWEL